MTLRRIIKIEEKKTLPKKNGLCIKEKTTRFVLFTDIVTKSTGIMSEYDLKRKYDVMDGFSSIDGKQLYMEKLK